MRRIYDVNEMLRDYLSRPAPEHGELIQLHGVDGQDGYNPSMPVTGDHQAFTYVRVEPRDLPLSSWSVPFYAIGTNEWHIDNDLPMWRIEDPFTARIGGVLVVGGVRILAKRGSRVMWETIFLRGESAENLTEFARSPLYMKDVRLVELEDGRIGVFTRPFSTEHISRPVGYTEIDKLDDLCMEVMENAPLLDAQPVEAQWWGVNAVYPLAGGKLGVLAHIATWNDINRYYYPIVFVFDRETREIVDGPRIIADRSCFPAYDARQPDLKDVVFPGWIDRERGYFYAGLSDAAIGVMPLADPFAGY